VAISSAHKKENHIRVKTTKMSLVFVFVLLVVVPRHSVAQSCLPYPTEKGGAVSSIQLVTLNKNAVVNSSLFDVSYSASLKLRPIGFRPAQYSTNNCLASPKDEANQLFSDRVSGVGTAKTQPK
jgi:hypothetical protein